MRTDETTLGDKTMIRIEEMVKKRWEITISEKDRKYTVRARRPHYGPNWAVEPPEIKEVTGQKTIDYGIYLLEQIVRDF